MCEWMLVKVNQLFDVAPGIWSTKQLQNSCLRSRNSCFHLLISSLLLCYDVFAESMASVYVCCVIAYSALQGTYISEYMKFSYVSKCVCGVEILYICFTEICLHHQNTLFWVFSTSGQGVAAYWMSCSPQSRNNMFLKLDSNTDTGFSEGPQQDKSFLCAKRLFTQIFIYGSFWLLRSLSYPFQSCFKSCILKFIPLRPGLNLHKSVTDSLTYWEHGVLSICQAGRV